MRVSTDCPADRVMRLRFERPARALQRAVFLDRDGVINARIFGGYVTRTSEFSFLPGVRPALRRLSRMACRVIIISNQAGVAKGLMSPEQLQRLTLDFVAKMAPVDAIYYCLHRPEDRCDCRKPQPGLLLQAGKDWNLDLSKCVFIGDSDSDMQAAAAAGCQGILLHGDSPGPSPERTGGYALARALPEAVAMLPAYLAPARGKKTAAASGSAARGLRGRHV